MATLSEAHAKCALSFSTKESFQGLMAWQIAGDLYLPVEMEVNALWGIKQNFSRRST